MSLRIFYIATLSIAVSICTAMLGVSRVYWGYWTSVPSSYATISTLVTVERFTTLLWDGKPTSGREALERSALNVNYISGDRPLGRVADAIYRRHLFPESDDHVEESLLPAITATLAKRGDLRHGEPGYLLAEELFGDIVVGRNRDNRRVVIAALSGGQVSDDHLPYYEVLLEWGQNGELVVKNLLFYWYDVAGLEGLAHWLAGLAAGVIVTELYLVFGGFYILGRSLRRGAGR